MATCTVTLPAANADVCAPNAHFGRIDAIFWTRWGDSLTDVSDDTEWTTRLSNSTTLPSPGTDAPIRFLFGIGELPLPETSEQEISLSRVVTNDPVHTVTFNCDDTGSTNASLLASLQNANYTYAFWFLVDDQLYGGNDGFKASMRFNGRLIPGSRTEIQSINITAKWTGVLTAPVASPVNEAVGIE